MKRVLILLFAANLVGAIWTCAAESKEIEKSTDHSLAVSSERTRMGQSYNLNPDCTSSGMPSARLLQKPQHGAVEIIKEGIFSNYTTGPRVKCNTKRSRGLVEYYTSVKGYVGADVYKIRVSYGDGTIKDVTVNIKVLKN